MAGLSDHMDRLHRTTLGRRGLPVAALLVGVLWPCAGPAQTPADTTPHSEAVLVSEHAGIRAGRPFTVALHVRLDPGWHTYWKNPGDSGTEATLEWLLPDGFTAGPIQWPRPVRIPYPPLMSYAYEDEVLLPVEITPPAALRTGTDVGLEATADFLVCEEICLVATTRVTLELPVVAGEPAPSELAAAFRTTRLQLPADVPGWTTRARSVGDTVWLGVEPPAGWSGTLRAAYFYPHDPQLMEHALPQPLLMAGGGGWLGLVRSPYRLELPDTLEGILTLADGLTLDDAGHVTLAVATPIAPGAPPVAAVAPTTAATPSLVLALVLALLGGVLLNLMPCVFPVLSLKVLGFLQHAGEDPRVPRYHGLAYAAGIVLSFVALAGALLMVRSAGSEVGWGFQLQSPLIVALLAFLMLAIGLNFLGLLEFGAALTRLGRVGAEESGYRGSFLTGVLAVIVATPCTAPFMGAAVGAALVRPAPEALTIFAGLGVGMAAPYMVLSRWPSLTRRLPAPGRWMETLRQALAFPMFGVAVWLLWVLGLQVGVGGATGLLFAMLVFAFGAWMLARGTSTKRPVRRLTRPVAALIMVAAMVWGTVAVAGREAPTGPAQAGPGALAWEPFTPDAVAAHRAAGRAVFVDFTAAWCITCQVNERVVLSSRTVEDAFRAADIALVRADWTRRDAVIARALVELGRSGVPVYALYPADRTARPTILPTVLTNDIVLEALDRLAPARATED